MRVGEIVYLFSEVLEEIVSGEVEGFEGGNRTKVKVLQKVSEGYIRHIVSWFYITKTEEEALILKEQYKLQRKDEETIFPTGVPETVYISGMTVNLKQSGDLVRDSAGYPYNYQIVKVFRNSERVSLVNMFGESVGTFSFSEISLCSLEPIFKSSDYSLGQRVSWLEGEDVYEGVITSIGATTAEVSNIKKLCPLDKKKRVFYYKLLEADLFTKKNNMILASIVGDNIEE